MLTQITLEELTRDTTPIQDLPPTLVDDILKKANPEWYLIADMTLGSIGPAYACEVKLPDDITLDIAVFGHSEWVNDPVTCSDASAPRSRLQTTGRYRLTLWQLLVVEGNEVRTIIRDDGSFPAPVRALFEAVEKQYELKEKQTALDRTLAAAKQYVQGNGGHVQRC